VWSHGTADLKNAACILLDLNEVLNAHPPAAELFKNFAPYYLRNLLRWLKMARTNVTRQKRPLKITHFPQADKRIPQK
jgi:uncharacterized protein YdeI (YjbR/CyaY-like superfamily)